MLGEGIPPSSQVDALDGSGHRAAGGLKQRSASSSGGFNRKLPGGCDQVTHRGSWTFWQNEANATVDVLLKAATPPPAFFRTVAGSCRKEAGITSFVGATRAARQSGQAHDSRGIRGPHKPRVRGRHWFVPRAQTVQLGHFSDPALLIRAQSEELSLAAVTGSRLQTRCAELRSR